MKWRVNYTDYDDETKEWDVCMALDADDIPNRIIAQPYVNGYGSTIEAAIEQAKECADNTNLENWKR